MQIENTNTIQQLILLIDEKINHQLNVIMHHPLLLHLESSWRGLQLLVNQVGKTPLVLIRVLDINYDELQKDGLNAIEFDQSQLFRKIYSEEYDQPGGMPFGLILGDYYFSHRDSSACTQGMQVLQAVSKIAASAFAPFISAIAPSFFGVDEYAQLQAPLKIEQAFKQQEYQAWHRLRQEEDARFIGLTLPRILMRLPYNQQAKLSNRFFQEEIMGTEDYCWGNACYAYGCVAIQVFLETGWFAAMRGMNNSGLSGGAVTSLIRDHHATDAKQLFSKYAVDIYLTDNQEKILSEAGFLPLLDNPANKQAIFYSSQSIQNPLRYDRKVATANANLSSMIHSILCAARFVHYIKIIMRDKIGSFICAEDCEQYLQNWLLKYCTANYHLSSEAQAKTPLSEAKISVLEQLAKPGSFHSILHIMPHYQFNEIHAKLRFITKFNEYSTRT